MNLIVDSTVLHQITMINEKVLSVTAGIGLVIALTIIVSLSNNLLLGTLFGIALGIGLTMFIYERIRRYNYENRNQGYGGLVICTCVQSNQIICDEHDPKLLMTLSRNIPDEHLMTRLGLELCVNPNTIKTCRENNRNSIEQAVFHMLYHNWYKMQDGLGLESTGLKILLDALRNVNCDTYIQTIVQRDFLSR